MWNVSHRRARLSLVDGRGNYGDSQERPCQPIGFLESAFTWTFLLALRHTPFELAVSLTRKTRPPLGFEMSTSSMKEKTLHKTDSDFAEVNDAAPILLFDGECNLCNGWVQFVLLRESAPVLRFAALQSELGRHILQLHNLPTDRLDTMVLADGSQIYTHSTAVLKLTRYLRLPWRWATSLLLVPRFLRDIVYKFVARNRYRWFGKTSGCLVVGPHMKAKSRFL